MKNNWPTKKLGEVIDINFGERITRTNNSGNKYPVYGGGGESFRTDRFNRENEFVVSRFAIAENCVRFVEGKFWLMDSGGTFSIKNEFAGKSDKKFVGNVLLMKQKEIYNCARGGAQKNIDVDFFKKIKIPLPPLATQKQIVERLDKIAEAQKLNDELIQKSDELFQSLLHQELNPAGKDWEIKKLKELLSSERHKVGKLKREAYQESGKFPIIDQSVNDIAGYSDEEDLVYSGTLPLVIYGDHTRIVKFVDKPFILGADGTKILIPESDVLAKYLYFALHLYNVAGQGYKRHFPLLKEVKIPTPPIEIQKKIVEKLSSVQNYKKQLLEQKIKLKELFDSVLHKSFSHS